jgi:hypothetical protein
VKKNLNCCVSALYGSIEMTDITNKSRNFCETFLAGNECTDLVEETIPEADWDYCPREWEFDDEIKQYSEEDENVSIYRWYMYKDGSGLQDTTIQALKSPNSKLAYIVKWDKLFIGLPFSGTHPEDSDIFQDFIKEFHSILDAYVSGFTGMFGV